MSNHHPPPNHSRSSRPSRPNQAAVRSSWCRALLWLLLFQAAAAQNDTAGAPPDQPPDGPFPYGQRFNPSMAIIMVALVSAFFLLGFVSVYIRQCADNRFRGSPQDQSAEATYLFGQGAARGIEASVMESFPTFQYSSVKGLKIGKGSLECAVCLNEFEDDDVLRLLPRCNHVFHTNCIDAWLSGHTTCPVCRANLVPRPGEKFDPSILQVAEPEPSPGTTSGEPAHQLGIDVEDGPNVKSLADEIPSTINKSIRPPPRSRSTGMRFTRLFLFPRSHSTGHDLVVQSGEDHERFTLRLPDEVRDRIIRTASLNQAKSSAAALPRARSAKTGYRRSGSSGSGVGRSIRDRSYFNYERFDAEERAGRWGISMTPPFIGRTGSVRSARGTGGEPDDIAMTLARSASRSERSPPFDRLFIGPTGDLGERSSDRLRPPDNQV